MTQDDPMSSKITVQNIGQPGKLYTVDAGKYADMRQAMVRGNDRYLVKVEFTTDHDATSAHEIRHFVTRK